MKRRPPASPLWVVGGCVAAAVATGAVLGYTLVAEALRPAPAEAHFGVAVVWAPDVVEAAPEPNFSSEPTPSPPEELAPPQSTPEPDPGAATPTAAPVVRPTPTLLPAPSRTPAPAPTPEPTPAGCPELPGFGLACSDPAPEEPTPAPEEPTPAPDT